MHRKMAVKLLSVTVLAFALFFIAVLTVSAVPPAPSIPNDTLPADAVAVIIDAPEPASIVGLTTNVIYQHTAGYSLNCTLTVNGTNYTNMVSRIIGRTLTLPSGSHTASVTCTSDALIAPVFATPVSFTAADPTGPPTVLVFSPQHGTTIGSAVLINYSHTSIKPYNCTIFIDGQSASTAYNLIGRRNETRTLAQGAHALFVSCTNGTNTTNNSNTYNSSVISFTVDDHLSAVTLLSPSENTSINVNVTYKHNASTSANCTILFDSVAIETKTVSPNAQQSRVLRNMSLGFHDVAVSCTNGTWNAVASREIFITANPPRSWGGLTVTPGVVFPAGRVTINGSFGAAQIITVTIIAPDRSYKRYNVTSGLSGAFALTHSLFASAPLGEYNVTAYEFPLNSTMKNGTFTVIERHPEVHTNGNNSVIENTNVKVYGTEFLPYENITLFITGTDGFAWTNITDTNAEGEFGPEFYQKLPIGQYDIDAFRNDTLITSARFNVWPFVTPPNKKPVTPPTTPAAPPSGGGTTPPTTPPYTPPVSPSNPPLNQQPGNTQPTPSTQPIPTPTPTIQPEDDATSWWWYAVPSVFLLLLIGAIAYLYSTGAFAAMFGKKTVSPKSGSSFGAPIAAQDERTIKTFINGERSKGFDDLTIRGALISKGWDSDEVDRVFDEIYKGQAMP